MRSVLFTLPSAIWMSNCHGWERWHRRLKRTACKGQTDDIIHRKKETQSVVSQCFSYSQVESTRKII